MFSQVFPPPKKMFSQVTRTVRINKVVCDREKTARYCHRVPLWVIGVVQLNLIWWDEASGKLKNIYWQVFSSSYCKNMPGQECSMEPRQVTNCCTAKQSHHWIHAHALLQVCQPSCPQTNYCNTCTQFASTGGFAKFFYWKFLSFIGRFRQVPETHLPQFHRHRHGWNVILKEPLLEHDPQGIHSTKFSFLLKPLPIQAFF